MFDIDKSPFILSISKNTNNNENNNTSSALLVSALISISLNQQS